MTSATTEGATRLVHSIEKGLINSRLDGLRRLSCFTKEEAEV